MIEEQRVLDDDRPEGIDLTVLLCGLPGIQADLVADCKADAALHMKRLCASLRGVDHLRGGLRE